MSDDRRKTFETIAVELANMLHSDSHIPQGKSIPVLLQALIRDDRVPTLYEMECLVFGGPLEAETDDDHPDTEGEGNPEVDGNFPHTHQAISKFF